MNKFTHINAYLLEYFWLTQDYQRLCRDNFHHCRLLTVRWLAFRKFMVACWNVASSIWPLMLTPKNTAFSLWVQIKQMLSSISWYKLISAACAFNSWACMRVVCHRSLAVTMMLTTTVGWAFKPQRLAWKSPCRANTIVRWNFSVAKANWWVTCGVELRQKQRPPIRPPQFCMIMRRSFACKTVLHLHWMCWAQYLSTLTDRCNWACGIKTHRAASIKSELSAVCVVDVSINNCCYFILVLASWYPAIWPLMEASYCWIHNLRLPMNQN